VLNNDSKPAQYCGQVEQWSGGDGDMKLRLLQVGQRNFDDTREQLIRRTS
jgi:hypothetical protein